MRIVAIVQARMGSTRLPDKVMKELAGESMLARHLNRLGRAKNLTQIVVATSIKASDDVIVDFCSHRGYALFRGSEDDVLDRYYQAALRYQADLVVRTTSDCPLIEPSLVDQAIDVFRSHLPDVDYVSNVFPSRTFPTGLDTEVASMAALEKSWREDRNPAWREHVTTYIQRRSELFHIYPVTCETDYSSMRWTVDEQADLDFVRRIYDHFGHDRFSWLDILALLEKHPEWLEINRHVKQKEI